MSVLIQPSAFPVIDTRSIVKGSSDATKQIRFECDTLITTGQTRVITPLDSDGVMAQLVPAGYSNLKIPVFNASGQLGDSAVSDDGSNLTVAGRHLVVSLSDATISQTSAANTVFAGLQISTPTVAAAGNQQYSPYIVWTGYGWKTDATAGSQSVSYRAYVVPVQGTSAPTGKWILDYGINAGTAVTVLSVATDGELVTGNPSFPIKIQNWSAQATSWIDMPVNSGPSGIGSGGVGVNAWIAFVSGTNNWFNATAAGDLAYRNASGKKLHIGIDNGSGNANAMIIISGTANTLIAGTTSIAPLKFVVGTNLTSPTAGVIEYDAVQFYHTIDTSSGRGAVPVEQYFHLTSNGSALTSALSNFFGSTSNISLVGSGFYEIEIWAWFVIIGSGPMTWTFTNSAAPTSQNIFYEMSPITGIVAPPGTATMLSGHFNADATAARTIITGNLSAATHYMHIRFWLNNSTGTSLQIQVTRGVGVTSITPQAGSWWKCTRRSPNNIGTFAA